MTGNSKDVPSLYKRYLSTILHVNSWYDDDVFNPDTKGYKSIRQVRSMHRRVQQLMNERFQVKDSHNRPRLWMNQYDVAMTQFAFIGLAMVFPKKSALIAANHEDLEAINYYWRVLGWLMGMKDEFNACQFDKYEDIREFNRLILQHEYLEKFQEEPCPTGLEMTKAICLALHYFMPLITFNSLAHWWQDCFKFNGYEPQPMTSKEKILNMWTGLSFNHLLKYEAFLGFSNKLHKKRFQQRLANRDKVYQDLKVQYKDSAHLTFYSDRMDYFNKQTDNGKPTTKDETDNSQVGDQLCNQKLADTKTVFQGCPFAYETILPDLVGGAGQRNETSVAA